MALAASVVIPVHNAEAFLGDQLEALSGQVGAPEFEVVVVLNRCTDRSRAVAESFAGRLRLEVVAAEQKASAGYARNVGAARSTAPYILFCDADDQVGERWVVAMLDRLGAGDADVIGGFPIVDRQHLPDWTYDDFYRGIDGSGLGIHQSVLFPIGACLGVTRKAFDAVGGFDESFDGAGFEEVALTYRLLANGCRVGVAEAASFLYRPRITWRGVVRQQRAYANTSARFLLAEGRPIAATSNHGQARATARLVIHTLVRKKQWRPSALVTSGLVRWGWLQANRRALGHADPDPVARSHTEEFVVPLPTPILGGLGLRARSGRARWYATTGIEAQSLGLVEVLLRDGDVFVDCGANIGVFTVAAALRVGHRGRVISFEPDTRTRQLLIDNVERHRVDRQVTVHDEAVGATSGRLSFNEYANDVVSGFFEAPSYPGEAAHTRDVDVVRLDDAVDGQIDLVKIDVEGYETAVLDGAQSLLKRSPDAILIVELNPAVLRHAGQTPQSLLDRFPPDRWALWLVDEATGAPDAVRPFDHVARALVDRAGPNWYGNLLIVPRHRKDQIATTITRLG